MIPTTGSILPKTKGVIGSQNCSSILGTFGYPPNLAIGKYGVKITQDILNDYFELMDYIKDNLPKEKLNGILDRYLKILDSTRADIPTDLQDYWIKNQDRLGLKGKFLPNDSKLIPYQKEKE
jgi:hypothetical protein